MAVIFGLLPLMLATGLVMSPAMDARLPILGDLLGGPQSARTLHFMAASGLTRSSSSMWPWSSRPGRSTKCARS